MPKTANDWTVREYARLWARAAANADTSRRRKDGVAALIAAFDGRLMHDVRPAELRAWAADNGGSVRYAKGCFAAAVEDGVLEADPSAGLRVPVSKRVVVPPTEAEVLRAAEAALELPEYGREFRALILMAAFSGLRVSELCALEVRDIQEVPDFRVLVRNGKGEGGVSRDAQVYGPAKAALLEVAPEVGQVWSRPPSRGPGRLGRHDVDLLWRGRRKRPGLRYSVGLDGCRWHDLRHFHATWLLDKGNTAEDVAVQLHGHADPGLVVRTYGHPSLELARDRLRRRAEG